MGSTLGIASVVFLVLANGFFVATEFAIVAVRRSRLDEAARRGSASAAAARDVVGHLDVYIAACQLGITMASLALGWIGEPALAHLIEPPVESIAADLAPAASHAIAIGISFTLITTLHIVIGELAPKGLALQRPEPTALFVARPMQIFYFVFKWPITALNAVGNGVLRLFGLPPASEDESVHSVEELRLLLSGSLKAGVVDALEARIASRALRFADLTASALMTPRTELEAIEWNAPLADFLDRARNARHTRLLVFGGSLDNIVGTVHARDLLKVADRPSLKVENLLRPVLAVPEGKRADALLEEMRTTRSHVAVVVDEYGGTSGIVTLRDITGGLVGRIENEPSPDEVMGVEIPTPNGELILDGLTRLDEDFEELTGIAVEESVLQVAETLGGLVMATLGRIPDVGDSVSIGGRVLEVKEKDGMRVASVILHPGVEALSE